MVKRKVIKIDEDICNGCGECIPNCPEGALKVIDGKARLISDLFCDGLGACIGNCPIDAISIEEREAEKYDERKVMENISKKGENTIKEHLAHLLDHGENGLYEEAISYLKDNNIKIPEIKKVSCSKPQGCPGTEVVDLKDAESVQKVHSVPLTAGLKNWPIQIMLVPENAPYFNNADILIAADCTAFSLANFHSELLKGKVLLIGCPKLDDGGHYVSKLANIFKNNDIKSVTVAHMEVPCCYGATKIAQTAIAQSGREIPLKDLNISIKGQILN